jgi:hypothetical protein
MVLPTGRRRTCCLPLPPSQRGPALGEKKWPNCNTGLSVVCCWLVSHNFSRNSHTAIFMIAVIPSCQLLVPIVASRLGWNRNLGCLMHREFISLCIRHLRFPFWRSLGATFGTKSWHGKNNCSDSTPSLGTILGTTSPLESESQVPNA